MRIMPILPTVTPNLDNTPGKTESNQITMSDGATIDNNEESIHAYNEMRKRTAEAARQQYNQQQRANETGRFCPFHPDAHVNSNIPCRKNCALYMDNSCALAARPGKVNTSGRPCPFRRKCDDSCALFRGAGCTLTNTATAEKG